ncbi:MAG TPA: hypothetical protein VJ825_06475 [Gemmatimonadaceae bacterium]|nr:hypothetical protein [Gemmatimonadaceae bacterium]
MTRRQIQRRGRLYLDAVLTLEESTLRQIEPREQARLVAADTYRCNAIEREGVLTRARRLGIAADVISSVWSDIGEMERELRRHRV